MQDFDRVFDKLNAQYFDTVHNKIKGIYVDLEMIQDLKLGALLSTITVKEEMEYLTSRLPVYNSKIDLCCAKYFPLFKKTDEELLDIARTQPDKIALISPWTNIYKNMNAVITFACHNNKLLEDHISTIPVVINCGDMQYPVHLFDALARAMRIINPRTKVSIANSERYSEPASFYEDFDIYFLYDHERFLNNQSMLDMFTNVNKFSSKIIYTPPMINPTLDLTEGEYPKALASTGATLNLFCDFYYMPMQIPLADNK